MKDNRPTIKSALIAIAVIVVAVIAVVVILDSKQDTNQNTQPDTRNQQTPSGSDPGDGSINNITPNSNQSQVQDSEGTSPNIPTQ